MESDLIDTHLLLTFVTVADSTSFTEASARLGVTQSAVSQALKQLERIVGSELIIRRSRPLRLTAAGQILKNSGETILADLRRLNANLRDVSDKALIQCRLGLVTSCSEVFGSGLIAALGDRIERLTLRSGMTPTLVQAFLDREIDVLVSSDPLPDVGGVERFHLCRDPMMLVCSESMLRRVAPKGGHANAAIIHRLAESVPLIRYGRNTHIGALSEVALRRANILANLRYETDDTHTLIRFVQAGHGWAVLSGLCLAQVLTHARGIVAIELDSSRHARDIYLTAREGELGSIPGQVAMEIREIFQSEIYPQLKRAAPWVRKSDFLDSTEEGNGL